MADNNNQSQVLIVDDSRVIRRAATKILDKEFDVIEAEDGEEAWEELQKNRNISVVFTDLGMPNMDGYELLETIRKSDDPGISNLPVIIITGAEESEGAREDVLEMGATDFISKPFDSASLKSRAATHINYRREVRSLEKRAGTDALTGLATEASFVQQGEQSTAYAIRHCTQLTLVRFDLDKFADLFVKLGKDVAEQVLAKVASIIKHDLRKEDTAARLGVSKFALLLPSTDPEGAMLVANRIAQHVTKLKLKVGTEVFKIHLSTGITSPEVSDELSFKLIMDQAEAALKKAAATGDGKVVSFQGAVPTSSMAALDSVDISLDELLQALASGSGQVSKAQLVSAMRKFLPLMEQADQQLKLGLAKVVLHLKKRLNG